MTEQGSAAPEILQFGTGRFLRGFFAPLISQPDSIAVVQSQPGSRGAELINQHSGSYHVWVRGIDAGQPVDRVETVDSLGQAYVATEAWSDIQTIAGSSELKLIVSNTTEKGLTLDESDDRLGNGDFSGTCPRSYPAKLTALLFTQFKADTGGLTILPTELIEFNAVKLLELVREQATRWTATNYPDFLDWLQTENRWLSTLVDRIVVSPSEQPPWDGDDDLAVMTESYQLLAIQDDGQDRGILPDHPAIQWTDDLTPWFLQKVRILNGLHTAMVARSLPRGFELVIDVMNDAQERDWYERMLNEEVIPALASRGMDVKEFARATLDRLANPYFQHKLSDIANNHESKLPVRIGATIDDFRNEFKRDPQYLSEIMNLPLPV